ncbi:DEAD/DEAH box helicase [Pleionea litopenaei]|uniref:DEAD/DEAH box helicase family protein n=1 Tax=Pleionea litopenaei TaxID=3070815 RepID=A0AA51RSC0_9GAMM|nr:DEAD/DEAH box helicase family protein [Pleionea sp. HL-JVS1]WMS86701.1 DEAD/DEAH box helicase family protein [Pleionea sp. HL-JVS1]
MKLRNWQRDCVAKAHEHFKTNSNHFLCLATPGAGKTVMAAQLAKELYETKKIDLVLCFSPSISVARNMQSTFERLTNKRFDGKVGALGCSYTYQSMINLCRDFWDIFETYKVLVVFDEIHHCGGSSYEDANRWGQEIIVNIKEQATYSLAMTGTPWRSDQSAIVLSQYQNNSQKIECHYTYGLREAINDKVCRKPTMVLIDNECILLTENDSTTKEYSSLQRLIVDSGIRYEDIIYSVETLRYILGRACSKLSEIRNVNPLAGGLIVASSVRHAELVCELIRNAFNQSAVMVSYQHKNSAQTISQFRNNNVQWIVSIGMVSEGTDIPRLQVCCHLSRIRTELYFRQVLGRILRTNQFDNQEAWLFTICDPDLEKYAKRIEEEVPEAPVIFEKVRKPSSINQLDAVTGPTDEKPTLLFSNEYLTHGDSTAPLHSSEQVAPFASETQRTISILGGFREQVIETFNSPF